MRIAYVGPFVSGDEHRSQSTVTEDWIRSLLAAGHDVHCLLDHNSAAAARVRDEGAALSISNKRRMSRPDGTVASADQMEAGLLRYVHDKTPLDLIVYSSDYPVDLSWHEPALADVPFAVVLGDGPARHVAPVLDHPDLTRSHARTLWARASLWSAADLLLSPCAPAGFGLRNDTMPQWTAVGPELADLDQPPAGLVMVLATTVDAGRAVTLLPDVFDHSVVTESTSVIVMFADLAVSGTALRELIMEGCPGDRQHQVVLVPDHESTALAGFTRVADVVLAESGADLVNLGLTFNHTPVVMLHGGANERPTVELDSLLVPAPPRILTLEVDGAPSAAVPSLEALAADPAGPDVVVLHVPAFTSQATRLASYSRLGQVDLALLSRLDGVFGGPDLMNPNRWVLAAHRRVWPSLIRRMLAAGDMNALITSVYELGMTEHVRLLVLPEGPDGTTGMEEYVMRDAPPWTDDYGVLGRPALSGLGGGHIDAPRPSAVLRLEAVRRLRRGRLAATVRKRYPHHMRRMRLLLEGKS